jgi:hypothetical protein
MSELEVPDWRNKREALFNLVDAAPDLLAACKAALGAFEHNHAIDWADLERAIDKAEGRPPRAPLQLSKTTDPIKEARALGASYKFRGRTLELWFEDARMYTGNADEIGSEVKAAQWFLDWYKSGGNGGRRG